MAYILPSSDNEDDELKKKNAAAAIGGEVDAATGGQMNANAPQAYTKSSFASAKNIFDKNKGAEQTYDVSQPFSQDLQESKSGLETSFGKLNESIGNQVKSTQVSDQDLSDAVAKGSQGGSFQKVMGALKPQSVSGKLDFVPNKYTANDVASLNTAPGIQAAIGNQAQKKGVQNYSQGMGALDAAIYQANPQYRQKINELSNAYGDYAKQKEDYSSKATQAIDKSNKELQDNAAKLQSQLFGQAQGIKQQSTVGNEGSAANKRALAAQQSAMESQSKQQSDIINKVAASIADPEIRQDFINSNRVNGLQGFGGISETGPESYTAEDAAKFNNIMALLGKSDRVNASDPIKANFNAGGFEDALKANLGKSERTIQAKRDQAAKDAQLKANEEKLKAKKPKAGDELTQAELDSLNPYERSIYEMNKNSGR